VTDTVVDPATEAPPPAVQTAILVCGACNDTTTVELDASTVRAQVAAFCASHNDHPAGRCFRVHIPVPRQSGEVNPDRDVRG
jgi:hypothetical protein